MISLLAGEPWPCGPLDLLLLSWALLSAKMEKETVNVKANIIAGIAADARVARLVFWDQIWRFGFFYNLKGFGFFW